MRPSIIGTLPSRPNGTSFLIEAKAFATVKADYDKVEDFFNHSSRFFERLSIIEGKISDVEPLGVAIVRVFSSQLSICATVESMISEKGSRWSSSRHHLLLAHKSLHFAQSSSLAHFGMGRTETLPLPTV